MTRKTILEEFEEEERKRLAAKAAENARLEELNKTDPAAVCRETSHKWETVGAPARKFCRHCGADWPG